MFTFFKIILVYGKRVKNLPTPKEHFRFQLDVHKCNSKENNSDCILLNTNTQTIQD